MKTLLKYPLLFAAAAMLFATPMKAATLTGNLTDTLVDNSNTFATSNFSFGNSHPDWTGVNTDQLDPEEYNGAQRVDGLIAGTLTYKAATGYAINAVSFSFAVYAGFSSGQWISITDGLSNPISYTSPTSGNASPWTWYNISSDSTTLNLSEVRISITDPNTAGGPHPWATSFGTVKLDVAAIPEPSTYVLLLATGLTLIAFRRRRALN